MSDRNNKRYKQGIYRPVNRKKYLGSRDPTYRSSWELKFFKWADINENVISWGSENVVIPYISPLDKRLHRYFVDNFVIFKDSKGEKIKFLIEIKPSTSVLKPVLSEKKKQSTMMYEQRTWVINQAKWKAAEKWAGDKGYQFLILTEKELNIRN